MSVSHTIRYALFGELLTETFAAYQDAASRDPFGTWFVLPTRNLADVILRHPIAKERLILPDHMLTARDFAQYICRETDPDLSLENRTFSSAEYSQALIFAKVPSLFLARSPTPLAAVSGHSSPVLSKI